MGLNPDLVSRPTFSSLLFSWMVIFIFDISCFLSHHVNIVFTATECAAEMSRYLRKFIVVLCLDAQTNKSGLVNIINVHQFTVTWWICICYSLKPIHMCWPLTNSSSVWKVTRHLMNTITSCTRQEMFNLLQVIFIRFNHTLFDFALKLKKQSTGCANIKYM